MDETIVDTQETVPVVSGAPSFLDQLARWVLLATFFLLPVFAVPLVIVPFGFSKTALFMILTAIAAGLWAVARLKDGELSFPRTALFPILLLLIAVSVVSTLASGAVAASWSGAFFDSGSLSFLITLVVFLFLFASLVRSAEQVFYAYLLFFISALLIALFHMIRFIGGPDLLSFGFFTGTTSTILDRWNDLAVFFGAVSIFALSTLEFMNLRAGLRLLFLAALVASLLILAVVNFTLVWALVGAFALVFLVYLISFRHLSRAGVEDVRSAVEHKEAPIVSSTVGVRKIPVISLSVFVCSIIFIIAAGPLGNAISGRLNIVSFEARPSFGATMDVARQTLAASPFFGAGPNLFVRQWLQFKPLGANQTIFWNTDFSSGVGFLPTILVTTGLLGAASWLLFLAVYAWMGFRFILSASADKVGRYLVGASFLPALFLWCVLFLYSSGSVILVLTFAMTALSLSALYGAGVLKERVVMIAKNPAISFATVLVLILFLLGDVAFAYGVGNRFASAVLYLKGVRVASEKDALNEAERLISSAAERSPVDAYSRALTEVSLARMNALLSSGNAQNADATREEFQRMLGRAIEYGRSAVALNGGNYENWLSLGRVYEAVVPLKISGAYDGARAAYDEALKRNPKSPAIFLTMSRLEAAKGDGARAREFIGQSLQAKQNYTEAIFFLSQLEVQDGNITAAIQSVEAALVFAPNDQVLRFQLGLLKYNEKDFRGSAGAFERAVALNQNYANARYFLGLSYERLNRDKDAIAQFELLAKTNPDNKEVALILSNLKAGRPVFSNAEPPVDEKPEKRSALPVKEKDRDDE
ncbi:MAG: Tfp pilus assembly protein PilF [Parcubacteria group bacterium Gr01-1014_17]|nr:MAG: Tfp pilus assembly protein PilF [Parcubacteria group bacterium Gr01-1014_17]